MDSKKNYFLPVITAILLLLSSCTDETNSDIIYDITPIYFNIKVINEEGYNMLDSKGQGIILILLPTLVLQSSQRLTS